MVNKKDIYVCLGILVVIFISFFIIGIFKTGHMPHDDGVLFGIYDTINDKSFFDSQSLAFKIDGFSGNSIRFRPLYYPYLFLKVYLFDLNILLNIIFTVFIGCLSVSFFYLGIRKFNCSVYESILFIFLLFIGNQIVVLQRNDPNETIGIFFLALSFYYLNNSKILSNILFSVFLILASWCKESFTLIIPAFIFLKYITDKEYNTISDDKQYKRIIYYTILSIPILVFFVNVVYIINAYNYTDAGYYFKENNPLILIRKIFNVILKSKQFLYSLLITFFIFLSIFIKEESSIINFIRKQWKLLVFLILFISPNIVLYANTNISERYLLPVVFASSFVCIILIHRIKNNYMWLYRFLIICITFSVLPLLYNSIRTSTAFVAENKNVQSLFKDIEYYKKEDSNILLVIRPDISWQISVLADGYLKYYLKKSPYFLFVEPENDEITDYGIVLKNSLSNRFKDYMFSQDHNYDILVFFDTNIDDYFYYSGYNRNNYSILRENNIFPMLIRSGLQ